MARPGTASADDASESVSPSSGAGRRELRCTLARNRHVSRAVALFAAAALAVSLSACSSTAQASKTGTFYGSELALGNGKVKTYVVTGDDGKPTELGFAFNAASLQGLPEPPHDAEAGPPLPSQPLYFPDAAKGVAVDHATFDFVPGGHPPPGVFDLPHFDVHFFYLTQEEVVEINPKSANFAGRGMKLPDEKFIPEDYGAVPNTPPEHAVVPGMGQHLADTTVRLVPGEYKFTEIILNGSWDGKYAFVEPMVTLDHLLSKPNVTNDLKLPQEYQKTGLYPTKYSITYDAASDTYMISLNGLVERTAS
jgi:Domain of unknown function (DUF5602)